jgi:hypothetical protein
MARVGPDGFDTWDVLRRVRVAIDTFEAPSMSVGDSIWFTSKAGEELGGIMCASSGWTRCEVKRVMARNGGHLCHV